MNEQFKELYSKAVDYAFEQRFIPAGARGPQALQDVMNEKFAELIVQEILQTCEEHPSWTGRMIGETVKEQFGVE